MTFVLLACYFVVGLGPLTVALGQIERRANAARVLPYRYYTVCVSASLLGLLGTPAAVLVVGGARWLRDPLIGFVVLSVVGWAAACVGAWAGVGYLRAATAMHADYGDGPAGAGGRSLEADVPEPRDGDHVRPD